MTALLVVIGTMVMVLITGVLGTVLNGWVLTLLWQWFIVPTFGLAPLALVPAIGVSLVAHYITNQFRDVQEVERSPWGKFGVALLHSFGYPLIALGIGAVVRMFM